VLQSLLNLFAGIAVAVSIAAIIIGIILRTRGDPRANNVMLYGFVGLLVALLGWPLVRWIFSGYTISAPLGVPANVWSVVVYALSATMVVASAVYIALGRVEEGAWSFIASILVLGLLGIGVAILTGSGAIQAGGGTLSIYVNASKTTLNTGDTLYLGIMVPNANNDLCVGVDWGDGSNEVWCPVYPNKWVRFSHRYSIPGDKPAASFMIKVNATEVGSNRTGFNTLGVIVMNPGYCPVGFPWNVFCGFARWVSQVPIVGGALSMDFQKLVMNPEFPLTPGNFIYDTYANMMSLALLGFSLMLAFSIAWSITAGETPRAVIASIKDAVVAIVLAILAPYIYNATASVLNTVSMGFVGYGYAIQGFAIAFYAIVFGVAAAFGYFVPFLSNVAAFAVVLLLIGNVIVLARWALILAIVVSSPLLALAYIHPALRGAVKHIIGLLAGLMLAGPIAAIAFAILGYLLPGQWTTMSILFPLFVQVLPTILGAFGGWAAAGAGEVVHAGIARAGRAVSRGATALATVAGRVGERVRLPAPRIAPATARARVSAPTTATMQIEAPTVREAPFRPVIASEDIAKAKEKGETALVAKVYESASPEERIGLGISYVLEGREGVVEHAKRLAPDYGIKPRWEIFKEAVKELGRRAARQYWLNIREGLKEFGRGLLHEAKIKIPRGFGGHVTTKASVTKLNEGYMMY
jgi:carbon starvation protein